MTISHTLLYAPTPHGIAIAPQGEDLNIYERAFMKILISLIILSLNLPTWADSNVAMNDRAQDLTVCETVLQSLLQKRNSLRESTADYIHRRNVIEANLPAYSRDAKAIFYQFNMPGLQIILGHSPFEGSHTSGIKTLGGFRLNYDPSKFSRFSVIRRMFGNDPLQLTVEDVRYFSQSNLMSDEGTMFEIYLKSENNGRKDGGMLMIARDTGQIRFWPPGADIEAEAAGLLSGSGSAMWNFATGLLGEAQNAFRRYTGEWFTDQDIIVMPDFTALTDSSR